MLPAFLWERKTNIFQSESLYEFTIGYSVSLVWDRDFQKIGADVSRPFYRSKGVGFSFYSVIQRRFGKDEDVVYVGTD